MGTGSSKFFFSKSLNCLTFLVLIFQIEYGTRFYGFEEEISDCSYATIDIISGKAAFSKLHFTFKTKEESGVLLYSEKNVSNIAFPFDFLRESNNCFILISFKIIQCIEFLISLRIFIFETPLHLVCKPLKGASKQFVKHLQKNGWVTPYTRPNLLRRYHKKRSSDFTNYIKMFTRKWIYQTLKVLLLFLLNVYSDGGCTIAVHGITTRRLILLVRGYWISSCLLFVKYHLLGQFMAHSAFAAYGQWVGAIILYVI